MKNQRVIGIGVLLAVAYGPVLGQVPDAAPPAARGPGVRATPAVGVVAGTIRQIDRVRNAVQVQVGASPAETRWVTLSAQTAIFRRGLGAVADLKPNDTIVISGLPASIRAVQIDASGGAVVAGGAMAAPPGSAPITPIPPPTNNLVPLTPLPAPGAPPTAAPTPVVPPVAAPPAVRGRAPGRVAPVPPGNVPGTAAPVPPAAADAVVPPPPPGGALFPGAAVPVPMPGPMGLQFTRVTGTVVTANPLVVALPGNLRLPVVTDATTQITSMKRATLTDLKPGDTVVASGPMDAQGNLTATRLEAGVELTPGGAFQRLEIQGRSGPL